MLFLVLSSVPSVKTLTHGLLPNGGTFNGEGIAFPTGNSVSVWFKYDKNIIPNPGTTTTPKTVTAVASGTPFPGFDVIDACSDYSYQVGRKNVQP